MTDRKLVYRIEVNTSQAKSEAKQFASQIKAELSNIKINVLDGRMFAGANAQITKLRAELQSLAAVQPPKVQIDTTGIQEAAKQADNLEQQLREVETQARRASVSVKAVSAPRTPAAVGASGIAGGLSSFAAGVLGGAATAAGIIRVAVSLDELRAKALRSTAALQALAGGGSKAKSILDSVQRASKGATSELQAQDIAVQGLALNLAKTPAEFERLVRAAKQITIGSATIKDLGTALTELSLFAANEKSFARADQLAVSAGEVKDRMAELQAQNSSLTDSQAKLLATMGALDAKFGSVTDSAAANASGIERVRAALADLGVEIATGPVGGAVDSLFTVVAAGIENGINAMQYQRANWKIILGVDDFQDNVTKIEGLISGANVASAIERGFRIVTGSGVDTAGLGNFIKTVELYNQAIEEGVPGLKEYRQVLDAIADDAADGAVTPENLGALQALNTTLVLAIQNYREFAAAQGAAVAGASAEEIENVRQALTDAITKNAASAAGSIGQKGASEFLAKELERVDKLIADFEAKGLKGAELVIAVTLATESLDRDVDELLAEQQSRMQEIFGAQISQSLGKGITALNTEAVDASPALVAIREELIQLELQYALTGVATEDMVAKHRELSATAEAVASSTGVYAALQNEQGQALLATNTYASELATQITALDAAQATGAIAAEQHAGALSILVGQLIALAQQAGVTGASLANLQAIQAGLNTTASPGFNRGATTGNAINAALAAQDATRQRELQRQAAERAAREQEQAAKRAGRELESGAKRAAKSIESALSSVEGLFGLSKVSQKDLDFAAAGGNVNFADDFVRRFRDLVDNGILHDGAGVGEVKRALQNIGIQPAEDIKLLLGQLEEAWQNSSLFANKDNLALINKDAVQQSLDLQAKMEDGRNNIMAFFGVTIDAATGAVSAAAASNVSGEELKTAVTDGQKKIADHLIATTGAAVDAATTTTSTASVSSGTVQITNVTIAPSALDGLFAGIKAPAIVINEAVVGAGFSQSAAGAIDKQFIAFGGLFYALGRGPGTDIENGLIAYWSNVSTKTTISDEVIKAVGDQLGALGGLFYAIGKGPAADIESGLIAYWSGVATKTNIVDEILAATAAQFVAGTPVMLAQGGDLANVILTGFNRKLIATQTETGLADNMRLAFGTQVQASRDLFTGQGNALAGIVEGGFVSHWAIAQQGGGMADAMLGQLSTQLTLPLTTTRLEGMGGGMAGVIMLGMADFDFGGAGGGIINQIESAITSEASLGRLTSVGGSIADALFNGFSAQIPNADWVGVIVGAVIAQLNAGVQQAQ